MQCPYQRGPLYFSLRIDKDYKSIRTRFDNYSYMGSVDWEIDPMSTWNYGLLIDRHNIMRGINISENSPGKYPFADKGDMVWSADSARYLSWTGEAPLIMTARGIRIQEWGT